MKKNLFVISGVLLLLLMLVLTACDNIVGLGGKVNTEKPVISFPDGPGNKPGTYLHGKDNRIFLNVDQPFGVNRVYMTVWGEGEIPGRGPGRAVEAKFDKKTGQWFVDLDVSDMSDGQIITQVTAIDVSGNKSKTTDIIYFVKNQPPEIELTIPRIKGYEFDDPDLDFKLQAAPIIQGNPIMGIAADGMGIKAGYPQILIWPANLPQSELDGRGIPYEGHPKYKWHPVLDSKEDPVNPEGGLKAVQFRWPLRSFDSEGNLTYESLPSGDYRVRLRIMDEFNDVNEYPNRFGNRSPNPKQYMTLKVIAAVNPVITWVNPFPQYYNGKGPLEGQAWIETGNPEMQIFIRVSNDSVVTYQDTDRYITPADGSHYYGGGLYNISIPEAAIKAMIGKGDNISGDKILHIRAVDTEGNKSETSRPLIIDTEAPAFKFIDPNGLTAVQLVPAPAVPQPTPAPVEVTSSVTIRGNAADNQRVTKMYYALGRTEANAALGTAWDDEKGWTDTRRDDGMPLGGHPGTSINATWSGSLSSWTWRFDDIVDVCAGATTAGGNYFVTYHGSSGGNNLWLLPIKFKLVDVANNVTIVYAEIIVNPEADKPKVVINSHTIDRQEVGGEVQINGTASDNEWIHSVEIRITRQSYAAADANVPFNPNDTANNVVVTSGPGNDGFVILHSSTCSCTKHVPYSVGGIGSLSSNVSWFYNLNKDGALTYKNGSRLEVLVEVRARDAYVESKDTPKQIGPKVGRILSFDSGVPEIIVEKIIRGTLDRYNAAVDKQAMEEQYQPGISMVAGNIVFIATLRDDHDITNIKLRGLSGTDIDFDFPASLTANSYAQKATIEPDGIVIEPKGVVLIKTNSGTISKKQYTMFIPLNTAKFSGIFNMDVEVLDNTYPAPYKSQKSVSVIIDNEAPKLQFILPEGFGTTDNIPELTSAVTIRGTATDNQGVVKMYYALGKKETNPGAYSLPALGVTVNDNTGWSDTWLERPAAQGGPRQEHKPGDGIRAKWEGSFNNWSWEFANIADLYLSPQQATVANKGNDFLIYDPKLGSTIWYLPIKFKLVDSAGNVTIIPALPEDAIRVIVDPDKDRPNVTINSPGSNDIVGGEVRINGLATDNEIVYDVQIRITAQRNSEIVTGSAVSAMTARQIWDMKPGTWKLTDISGSDEGFIPVKEKDIGGIIGSGSTVNWYYNINGGTTSITHGLTPPVGQLRVVKAEVRARDASLYSPNSPNGIRDNHIVRTIYLTFSATVPTIDDVRIIRLNDSSPAGSNTSPTAGEPYTIGTTVSNNMILRARIKDESGIESIKIRGENMQAYSEDLKASGFSNTNPYNPWVQKTNNPAGGGVEYYLFIPLKTNYSDGNGGLWNGRFNNRAGSYNMDIQVLDDTTPISYQAQQTVSLQIDNYFPGANFTGSLNAFGNKYSIYGNAWDTGDSGISVSDVDKVVVYFSEPNGESVSGLDIGTRIFLDGTKYNPANSAHAAKWTAAQKVKIRRVSTDSSLPSAEGDEVTLPFFPVLTAGGAAGAYTANNTGIVINDAGGTIGSVQSFRGVPNKVWSTEINTRVFQDGYIYINYVVFDKAGNASYFRDRIYITNNRPQITKIQLGTDIDKNGSVTTGEGSPPAALKEYSEYDSDKPEAFRIRNNRFSVMLDVEGGNDQKRYRVSYATPKRAVINQVMGHPTLGNFTEAIKTSITKGNVYTIINMGNITTDEWINIGVIDGPASGLYNDITFVAKNSYAGPNSAKVYLYEYGGTGGTANTFLQGNVGTPGLNVKNFVPSQMPFRNTTAPATVTNFGSALIPDSDKNTSGIITGAKQRYFVVKVYDTTISGGAEADQLADAKVIAVDIDNTDTRKPTVSIDPFYWNSAADNSLYLNSRANGHIELEAELPAASFTAGGSGVNDLDPKVSGIISVRGTAFDSNTIGGFYFRINNHVNTQTSTITEGGNTYYLAALYNGGAWVPVDRFAADGWKFSIEPGSTLDMTGHSVKWRLDFDSSFITNVTNTNNILTIVALDTAATPNRSNTRNPNSWTADLQTGAARTEHYRFDVVPYIREVVTPLSWAMSSVPSSFNRSARGWYPVREGDLIQIRGFNLGRTAAEGGAITPAVTVNGTGLRNIAVQNKSQISASIIQAGGTGNTITSGPLSVTVGSISALNNKNSGGAVPAPYNQEPNGLNNNILNDDRYLYVWNTGYLLNNRIAQYPIMRMNSNSGRYLIYTDYVGNGRFHVAKNNSITQIEGSYNRYINTGLAIDEYGDWYAGISNISASGGTNHFSFHGRGQSGAGANGSSSAFANLGDNKRRIVTLQNDVFDENRVRFPRIAARNTAANPAAGRGSDTAATRIFMSYYDNNSGSNAVYLHYGAIGANFNTGSAVGGNFSDNSAALPQGQVVANNRTVHKGGLYTAVGGFSNGLPVIAWYDRINQNLVFSHGSSTPTGTANNNDATVNLITADTGMEYVYTAAGHGLSVSSGTAGNANSTRVLVSSNTVDDQLRYVRKIRGDNFALNVDLDSGTNIGADYGDPITVTPPIGVTSINGGGTARTYTLATGHGLANNDEIYYCYGLANTTTALSKGYVWQLNNGGANRIEIWSAESGTGTRFNTVGTTANQMYIYPVKNMISAVRSEERYYYPNTGYTTTGQTVAVNGTNYYVAESWTGNGTANFKLRDSSGAVVDLGGSFSVNASTWQGNAVVIKSSAGTHVDMAVDYNNNVHLAYYDVLNGGLHYTYIPSTNGRNANSRPNTAAMQTVKVDTYLSAGTKIMINVREETHGTVTRYVPYISYFHSSFSETRNSIRVAWQKDPVLKDGTDSNDRFTGTWEVMTVPTQSVPLSEEFICNGVPASTTGTDGWANNLPTGSSLNYTGIARSILVGYMTTDWYEGAALKYDIITSPGQ